MKYDSGWILICLLAAGCSKTTTPQAPTKVDSQKPTVATQPVEKTTPLSILAWNLESGGNDPELIARQLSELGRYDIYCLCEVHAKNFKLYANALPTGFVSVNSTLGGGDRMQIIFDSNRFELLQQKELHEHGQYKLNNGNHRSPMFVRLKDRESSIELIVMTNHLARRNAELRKQQAVGMREWARDQSVAVINIGDFNMDYDFHTRQGNSAFPEMIRDNVWDWVKPEEFIDTNWSDPDGDGNYNYPDSMLDFAFVSGPAKDWNPVCKVIVRDGDFPDDKTTSDHRPIELRLMMPRPN